MGVINNNALNQLVAQSDTSGTLALQVNGSSGLVMNSSLNVGINNTTPTYKLDIIDEANFPFAIKEYNNSDGATLRLFSARGTKAAPTAVTTNSILGGIRSFGWNGSAFSSLTASVDLKASETFTTTAQGSYIAFTTTAAATTTLSEQMRIDPSGNVGIGTTTPSTKLHVVGNITQSTPAITTWNSPISVYQNYVASFWNNGPTTVIGHNTVYGASYATTRIGAGYAATIAFSMDGAGSMDFSVAGTDIAGSTPAFVNAMRIDASGNVLVGTTSASVPSTSGYISTANTFGFKNRIINGDMNITQRGTSFSSIANGSFTTANGYTLDRWFGYRGAYTANLDISYQAGFSGFASCIRLQRTAASTSTQLLFLSQIVETANIRDLAGKTVTFSAYIRAGSNYSGGQVSMNMYTSTAADQTSPSLSAGTWTGLTTLNSNKTITTTGTLYTFTTSIPSNVLSLAGAFLFTPTGTAGANDYIEITGVQLEAGSVATVFDKRPFGTELALCQRYYWKTFMQGTSPGDNVSFTGAVSASSALLSAYWGTTVWFPTIMRVTPTLITFNPGSGTTGVWKNTINTTTSSQVTTQVSDKSFNIYLNGGSTFSNGPDVYHIHVTANAEI